MITDDDVAAVLLFTALVFVLIPLILFCLWEAADPLPLAPRKKE